MQDNIKDTNQEYYDDDNGPGLDKEAAIYKAQREGDGASPCGYCNRGDCIECSFAYK